MHKSCIESRYDSHVSLSLQVPQYNQDKIQNGGTELLSHAKPTKKKIFVSLLH